MSIVVAHPAAARRLGGRKWLYADGDIDVYLRLASLLGEDRLWLRQREFQAEAERLVDRYIAWCDRQISRAGGGAEWFLSAYHRHPFESDQLVHLVWLHMLQERLGSSEDVLVLTAHAGFARALADLARDKRWPFHNLSGLRLLAIEAKRTVKAMAYLFYDAARWISRMLLSRVQLRRHASPSRAQVVLAGYFHADAIGEGGEFNDRYFRDLGRWYEEHGFSLAYMPFFEQIPLRSLPRIYKRIARSRIPVLLVERFASLGDVARSVGRCLSRAVRARGDTEAFLGLDTSRLAGDDATRAALWGLTPLLLQRRAQRLLQSGFQTDIVLEWFENQRIGRASALGWAGRVRHVALRQYVPGSLFTNLFCTSEQVRATACPAEEWVCGSEPARRFALHAPELKIRVVPALRYRHLYEQRNSPSEGTELLVALSHSLQESKALLTCVLGALSGAHHNFSVIRVKPHPVQNVQALQRWWAELERVLGRTIGIEWATGNLDESLARARVLMTGGSGVGFEAVCRGIPVLVVARPVGVDIAILESVDSRLWTRAYSAEDARRTIRDWSPEHPLPRQERLALGRQVLERHFEYVDAQRMTQFAP